MPSAIDARFITLTDAFHAERLRLTPTRATGLGLHAYDAELEDYSLAGARARRASLARWRELFAGAEFDALSAVQAADRTWLLAILDGELFSFDVMRPLETDPDVYVSGLTESAFVLISRDFAAAETRLGLLLQRMRQMPAVLELARLNLGRPPRIRTELALEQLQGNREFFLESVPEAFNGVADAGLQSELASAIALVDAAFVSYGEFLAAEVLPRSDADLAIGADGLLRLFHANELLDLPLARLLEVGQADLNRNQQALRLAAARIDSTAPLEEVLSRFGATHVRPDELLETTQGMLGQILTFLREHDLLTVPPGPLPKVMETPSFLRATTSAAMDTPGPYEAPGMPGYYYMTLPNPEWPAAEQDAYMQQWTLPLIANLSVHEAYPGHYVQFLLTPVFPTLTRQLLYAPSNAEGWAHYCEQMMLEEGFGGGDPWAHVAQLQDALLRNVRLVVCIKLHTGELDLAEAQALFERDAHLEAPLARAEAWRGAIDPTYGYYTLGKLMMLKLRADVKQQQGKAFSLKAFHDAFLNLGALPLPLVRQALLGDIGEVL